jgi:ACT domain-containing protein
MKIVVTIIGQDRVGIVARAAALLAERSINILDINQNIVHGFFNMVLIAEMTSEAGDGKAGGGLRGVQEAFREMGTEMDLDIKVQHEDIFLAMHKV